MKRLLRVLFAVLLCSMSGHTFAAEGFPNRALFPTIAPVELNDLYAKKDQYIIIDVRSAYEFDTLHINGAKHIPLDDPKFDATLTALRAADPRPMAFYCNGHACKKSYEAALKAMSAGLDRVYAYDAGIIAWTTAHPADATLLGKTPVDPAKLISEEKLKARYLEPAAFAEKVNSGAIVVDIREVSQRLDILPLFPTRQHNASLDNKELKGYIEQAKKEGKPLLVYDAVGKQVEWLPYFLESEGLGNYYFLKGGAKGFMDVMMKP